MIAMCRHQKKTHLKISLKKTNTIIALTACFQQNELFPSSSNSRLASRANRIRLLIGDAHWLSDGRKLLHRAMSSDRGGDYKAVFDYLKEVEGMVNKSGRELAVELL
jgi:hypothetical protein